MWRGALHREWSRNHWHSMLSKFSSLHVGTRGLTARSALSVLFVTTVLYGTCGSTAWSISECGPIVRSVSKCAVRPRVRKDSMDFLGSGSVGFDLLDLPN